MHKNIYDVLNLMDRYSGEFSFRMMSNGLLLDDSLLKRLKTVKIPCLQMSLDGGEANHDSIRGKGNFKGVTRALERLYQYGIPAKISFTAHQDNYRDFPAVAQICRDFHVSALWSDRYIPCGASSDLRPLDPVQTKEYVAMLQAEKNNPLNRTAKLQILNRRSLQFLSSGEYPYHCTAGISSIAVDDKGNVYPCRRMAIQCGNVFETDLCHIYENDPTFNALRNTGIPAQCASCRHAAFCRGGAKCLSYAQLGDVSAKDPGCWL